MSYIAILRRAVRIMMHQPSPWALALVPALLAVGGLALAGAQAGASVVLRALLSQLPMRPATGEAWAVLSFLVILIGLLWGVLALLGSYCAQAGLIAMIAEAAGAGQAHLHTGLRWGQRRGLSLLLIALLVIVPILLATVALSVALSPPAAPLLFLMAFSRAGHSWLPACLLVLSLRIALGLALLTISITAGILLEIAYRRCVLAGEGALTSIRSACWLLRAHWRACFGTWLSLLAVSLALIVIGAPLGLAGLVCAAALAALVAALLPPLAALIVVSVPGLLLASAILAILTAAHIFFHSTVWTLAYRQLTIER